MAVRDTVSDKPWSNFTAADYTPAQWTIACLVDTKQGASDSKDRYKIPVREPDGTLNRNGCHAAAAGHGISALLNVSIDTKKAAARKLVSLYRGQLKEDPPASLLALAGMSMNSAEGFQEFYRDIPFNMAQSDGLNFSGYAAVFDTPTRIDSWEGEFDEQIAQGAFARTLREKTPVLMFEHGRHPLVGSMPLGVINNAYEDSQGLFVEARLTDNWLIQPVRDAVEAGAISGMSFRFSVPEGGDKWEQDNRDVPLRTLTDLDVRELGPVVFPAYEPTTAQVRSMLDQITRVSAGRSGARSTGGGASVRITNEMRVRDRMLRLKGIL
jgi:hypothetical protein